MDKLSGNDKKFFSVNPVRKRETLFIGTILLSHPFIYFAPTHEYLRIKFI